jgi:hypothetical protein
MSGRTVVFRVYADPRHLFAPDAWDATVGNLVPLIVGDQSKADGTAVHPALCQSVSVAPDGTYVDASVQYGDNKIVLGVSMLTAEVISGAEPS